MINNKKILAVTPARGGSKGLPGKNIKNICGKPLLCHSIDIAKASQYVDDILVSTDCSDIAEVARAAGAEVYLRPVELATDTALVADVLRHLIENRPVTHDYIVLLEATSPMRTVEVVDECIELLSSSGADSVATFSKAEPPPTRLWKIKDKKVDTYLEGANPWLPRQMQEDAYCLNGMVYMFHVDSFIEARSASVFWGERLAVVTENFTVDIDTLEDFELAEYLMEKRNA